MSTTSVRGDRHKPIAYSIEEACRVSSIGRTNLYRLIKQGHLETRKVGKRTLVLSESLEQLIKQGCPDG